MPQTAIRHAIFHTDPPVDGNNSRSKIPIAYTDIPAAAVAPGLCRSTNLAASGDIIIVASGHGVIRNPVVISEKPKLLRNKNGSAIIATFCATNEHMEVMMLKE